MARTSVHAFLAQAKRTLEQAIRTRGPASFVIGNESADLDSITCALVYGYIQSSTAEAKKRNRLVIPVTNISSSELRLRTELAALLKHADLQPKDLITLDDLGALDDFLPAEETDWTLVDHNALQGALGRIYGSRVVGTIDHHDDEGKVPDDAEPRIIKKTGSCNSHVANYCRAKWDSISSPSPSGYSTQVSGSGDTNDAAPTSTWDAQVAKLSLGSILIDTVNLSAGDKVTEDDQQAVRYLEAKINSSEEVSQSYNRDAFFQEINAAKSNLDSLSLQEILRKDYKQWTEGDLTVGISSVVQPVEYLRDQKAKDIIPELLSYARERKLQLFAIMTAHNANDDFERQLLLLSVEEGAATESAREFAKQYSGELQLQESETKVETASKAANPPFLRLWDQKNLAGSRKKAAPMLREVMKRMAQK